MAMQPKAWITCQLFKAWIGYFVKNVHDCGLWIVAIYSFLMAMDVKLPQML
jgi:hypothetical protein